jgi:hypothetical protein
MVRGRRGGLVVGGEVRFDNLDFLDTIRAAVLSVWFDWPCYSHGEHAEGEVLRRHEYCPPCYLINNDMSRLRTISLLESPSSKIHTC